VTECSRNSDDMKDEMFIHQRDLKNKEGQSLSAEEGNPGTLGALEVWEKGETGKRIYIFV